MVKINHYTVQTKLSGDLLLAVKNTLQVSSVLFPKNIFVAVCYIPPNLNPLNNDIYDSFLQHLYYIDNIKEVKDDVLILGTF